MAEEQILQKKRMSHIQQIELLTTELFPSGPVSSDESLDYSFPESVSLFPTPPPEKGHKKLNLSVPNPVPRHIENQESKTVISPSTDSLLTQDISLSCHKNQSVISNDDKPQKEQENLPPQEHGRRQKQKNPRKSPPANDPNFRGVALRMRTELVSRIESRLHISAVWHFGKGRKLHGRRRGCHVSFADAQEMMSSAEGDSVSIVHRAARRKRRFGEMPKMELRSATRVE